MKLKKSYRIPVANPYFTEDEKKAVLEVLESKQLSQGPKVAEFEGKFAEYVGVKHAIAVSNGTVALHTALSAIEVNSRDEVIVPSYSFIAPANAVLYQKAKPVFVDIDPKTYNLNPNRIEKAVTKRTRAIIPVHYGGQSADMNPIMEIAEDHNLIVIEDAAEAHGSEYKGKIAGSLGHMACFSFYPNKNMTTGEGGMITTNNDVLAEKMREIRNHGQDSRYHHVTLGYNYRITELQAAIGLVQLKRLPWVVERKIELAHNYDIALANVDGVKTPYVAPYAKHTYMLYALEVKNRDRVQQRLEEKGIETRICFPPIHLQPLYRELFGYNGGEFPITEETARKNLCIPIYPQMSNKEQNYVIDHLKKACNRHG